LCDTDATPFRLLVNDHAAAFIRNQSHGSVELAPAIASDRAEDIASEALRVYARERRAVCLQLKIGLHPVLECSVAAAKII